ncbi:MAG: hypothetical protein [Olavius algarvensis Delta 4 endosymbiont]|nr:MAG: hypothetical protein [Olavius algarvensis Delta 4 endosymbiont]
MLRSQPGDGMIKGHGGNIYALAREQGCTPEAIADMSSNVNPFGALPGLQDHLLTKVAAIESLPEADAAAISALFAEHCGVTPENVAPGNGSTQLLYALPRALETRKALIVGPTYADYASACRQQGILPDYLLAEEERHFAVDLDQLASLAGQYDTVFICNPNNPTGVLLPATSLAELFASNPETTFIVDESYLPFAQAPEQSRDVYANRPNVVRLTSMSKIFKIPGLRIGFAVAHAHVIARLQRFAMPWSVNSLACEAVVYILQNPSTADDFIQETQVFLARERELVLQRFAHHPSIQWYPSCTSFMLARLKSPHTAAKVHAGLARNLILVRDCSNFKGLTERHVRISLKNSAANKRFCVLLTELLEKA